MIPVQPYLPWKVSITILHVVAASSSVLRVEYRRRTHRVWWDDYASIVPAVFECFTIINIWLRFRHYDNSEHSRQWKVALSYMNQTSFAFTIWWSRVSLALAVLRITPVWSKTRPWVVGITCAFILNCLALVLATVVICTLSTAWQSMRGDILICGPSYGVTLASIISDIIGDLSLVGFPLYRLWFIKLPPAQRRLVLLVFSTSLLTLAGAVGVAIAAYGKFFRGPGGLLVWLMTVKIEEAFSVFACNLPVLLSWGYRTFSKDTEDASGDHITPHWSRVIPGVSSASTYVLSDLSGASRSRTSEHVAQTSASEASLPSQITTHRKESSGEERETTEDISDAISRKNIMV
ncbi:hypothetical protein BDQ12DRAFT_500209 [Crucibulum laeve]|uniref:Rhodopsin domain-containing protein n=1 Tax=Crucibulum laeve TaxID=68775 RepID=A0A5C3LKT0_9AGAR|nr:hypothetical protein BDQ12DRAFT_500209 [Crucibulum laeve]